METAQEEKKKDIEPKNESSLKEKEKDLIVWNAPARPFKRRDRHFYITAVSIASLVCLILFLAEGAMPVILIISLIFLYYVLSTVEPESIEYRITNKGVKLAGKTTTWDLLGRFWFAKRYSSDLLVFEMFTLPGRLELVIDSGKKEEIKKVLSKYLTEEKISPSRLDRFINWFSKKLPQ